MSQLGTGAFDRRGRDVPERVGGKGFDCQLRHDRRKMARLWRENMRALWNKQSFDVNFADWLDLVMGEA